MLITTCIRMIAVAWITIFGAFLNELLALILPIAVANYYTIFLASGVVAFLVDSRLAVGLATGIASSLMQYIIFANSTSRFWSSLVSIFLGSLVIVAIYPAKTKPTPLVDLGPQIETLVVGFQ